MQFVSWQDYWKFESIVRKENRYFRSPEINQFLDTVLSTCTSRIVDLPQDKYLWRAQLGHSWRPILHEYEHIADEPSPYPPERMLPLKYEAEEGRVNPKGIPYLYLGNDKNTAMAEVRPWLGTFVSLGQFKITKRQKLIDCSLHQNLTPIYIEEPIPEEREQAVWSHIDQAFSRPTTNTDRNADYVPTQIIAELFKTNGFDGIIYKSLLGKGHNVALFNVEAARLVNCYLFEVEKIDFQFSQAANPYSIRKQAKG
ncbi:MAG: RES family NAD+ phosphorylase [Pseudomonadota bacterium]